MFYSPCLPSRFSSLNRGGLAAPWCGPLLLFLLALSATHASAQRANVQYINNKADQALRSDLRIDPSTLGMSVQIPLGAYPGRGISLPVTLNYSSKIWRIDFQTSAPGISKTESSYTKLRARSFEFSTAGWTSSLGVPTIEYSGEGKLYNNLGQAIDLGTDDGSLGTNYIARINVHMPDGSSHELRKDDVPHTFNRQNPNYDWTGVFYAVDGSRMRFESASSTLFLPDGSRYVFYSTSGPCSGTVGSCASHQRLNLNRSP